LEKLSEIAIPIEEGNLIPHFKYVSMHLSHDKCIYLLYAIRKSADKMKEHKIIDYTELKEIERRLDKLLAIAWREKGQYPGFKNALQTILKDDFRKDQLKELIPKIEDHILKNFDSLDNFWESSVSSTRGEQASSDAARAIGIISKKK
jgi:exodeoxyribonuclease V alpha subunit